MRLSVNVSLPLIERMLNQRYDGMLYEGSIRDWTGGDSEVTVTKKGPLSLQGNRTYLKAEIPVSIKVQLRRNDPGLINAIKSIAGISRLDSDILASFRIHLFLQSDWSLACTVDADFEWLRKPTIGSILPVKISAWIEPAIRKGLDQQAEQIRQGILTQLGLPESLEDPWQSLFSPLELNQSPSLFASGVLQKREAPASAILFSEKELSIQVNIPIAARLSTEKSKLEGDVPLLPVLISGDRSEDSGVLPISWILTPDDILSFLPSRKKNPRVIMEAETQSMMVSEIGPLQASLRIFPEVSVEGGTLSIPRVEIIKGRMPGFLKSWLASMVRNRLNRQLEASISQAMAHMKQELRHLSLGSGWIMTAEELSYRATDKQFHPEGLHIQGELYGKVGLHLDDL